MSTLLKQLCEITENRDEIKFLREEMCLTDILTEDGEIVNESLADFFAGFHALIDRAVINQHNTPAGKEDEDGDGKLDFKDTILRYARILAGLIYYKSKDIKKTNNDAFIQINKALTKDDDLLNNVKIMGKKNADQMVQFIVQNIQTNKDAVKKLASDVQHYFSNIGTIPKQNIAINLA